MPLANLCLSHRESLIRVEVFGDDGKSTAQYEYRDVDLIEIKGTTRIDYSTFTLPKNMLCIAVEFYDSIRVVGKVLKIG